MRKYVPFLLLCVFAIGLLGACRPPKMDDDVDALVRVGNYTLMRSDVEKTIPEEASSTDSLLMAENFVKKWIQDVLIYEVAERNLGTNETEVTRLVEEYRRSLLRHRYLEEMIRSKLSSEINESDKMSYYQEHLQKFVLDKNLIKGVFVKIPADAPGLEDMRKWYKSKDAESIENIEKYSVQNASIYDYFYDRWVDFDEAIGKIPIQIPNKTQFLKTNQFVEVTDSSYCYFLNISEYLLSGNIAPYEYAGPQIQEMIVNQRRVEYLRNFEEELYRDAIRKGEVIFFNAK